MQQSEVEKKIIAIILTMRIYRPKSCANACKQIKNCKQFYNHTLRRQIGTMTEGFHKSWFDTTPQSSSTSREAIFVETLHENISSFSENGFVLIRRSTSQDKTALKKLESEILTHLSELESSFLYRVKRLLGVSAVRSAEKRHAISLPRSDLLINVASNAIRSAFPVLASQLTLNSALVDLSSIISLPGSERQKTHSDIAFSKSDKIISGFVALSQVNISNGPTCLFAGSHKMSFHKRHVDNSLLGESHYSADGTSSMYEQNNTLINSNLSETQSVELTMRSLPYAAILNIGDVLIYDSQLFHFGGANTSVLPRVLLMFGFQQCTPWGQIDKINGFTYHCDKTIAGKYCLNDFKT